MADLPSEAIDEARRRHFESAWAAGTPAPIESCLPPENDPLYPGTLLELVLIELEFRWKATRTGAADATDGPRIEHYVERFPRLRDPDSLSRLVEEEYRLRRSVGDRPSREEYRDRFPDVTGGLPLTPGDTVMAGAAPTRPASTGERLGRYRLVAEHARGGFGSVWRAIDEKFGREIAIKQLSGSLHDREEFRRRFLNEARVTARLEHPGIVPVYDMGEAGDDIVYYAMKLVRGRTLADAIDDLHDGAPGQRTVERRQLLHAFVFVCQTMEYAHARGVIHRDLKPQNIVLSDYGETVVLDWGLAKIATQAEPDATDVDRDHAGPDVTRPGTVQGTPSYMSPEQAAGRVELVDERSDVYSLGVMLYQLLTGRVPFDGETSAAVLSKVIEGRPPRPRGLAAVAAPLEAICLKAMATQRDRRYADVAALTRDLQHALADEPVHAYAEPWRARMGRWLRQHRALATGTAAAMFVALVALVVLAIVLSAANRRERQATTLARDAAAKERTAKEDARAAATREREQRERAAANFSLARDAVGRYFLRVSQDPRLRAVGLADLRKDLLEEAGDFYRRFAEQRGDDPQVRKERAFALRQLGQITEETDSPEVALDSYREAGEILVALTRQHPDDFGYRSDLADHHNVVGNALKDLNRYAEAEAAYRQALDLYATLDSDPSTESNRAAVWNNLAITCENTGRMADAEGFYRQALAAQRRLAERDPAMRMRVARTLQNLGMLLLRTGRLADAEQTDREALAVCEQLIAAEPDEPRHPRMRAMLQHNLAVVVRRLGRQDEALELYRTALEARRSLVETHRGVPGYLHELAATLGNLAVVHFDKKEYARSRELLIEARELRVALREMQPKVSIHEYDLAGIHINLGNILNREHKWEEAKQAFGTAKRIDEDLAKRFPDELMYLYDAGAANFMLAIATHNGGPPQAALPHYERATAWFDKVLEIAPTYIGAVRQLRACTKYRAQLEDSLEHYAEAAALWTRAIELTPDGDDEREAFEYQRALSLGRAGDGGPAATLARSWAEGATGPRAFEAAILLVVAANAAHADESVQAIDREARVRELADAAVALLERARADGVFADPQLRGILDSEREFDLLRERDDYRAVIERLDRN